MMLGKLNNNDYAFEILENSNDGINIVDKKGMILFANKMSADYANVTKDSMIGAHISKFYKKAVLLDVLESGLPVLDQKIHYIGNKKYVVNSYPLYEKGALVGAYSIFKDIRDIEALNKRIAYLELHLELYKSQDQMLNIIGNNGSLIDVLSKARRTVGSLGGPRHSIIIGQSGTGKTMLAKLIYEYAKEVGTIRQDSPLIEVNCAQFTNTDIAAMELFGSESGAFTGSKEKRGLFEQADGGILFLDEAHALGEYQNLLLKVIESGKVRRIGGNKEISISVIVIAASTKDLKSQLLPELYQRLAQYELYLPKLDERKMEEKEQLLYYFVDCYEKAVEKSKGIKYSVVFSKEAISKLLHGKYPRNIRQFRDVINSSIDAAAPLISDIGGRDRIMTYVEPHHISLEIHENVVSLEQDLSDSYTSKITPEIANIISALREKNFGPRRISNKLKEYGYSIEYYQVAYYLKNCKQNS